MYTICYSPKNTPDENKFETCTDAKYIKNNEFDINTYEKDHPNISIYAIYDTNDNIIRTKTVERMDFEMRCDYYGFDKSDYNRILKYKDTMYRFTKFLPNRRKYVCCIEEINGKSRIAITKSLAKRLIDDVSKNPITF